MLPRIIAVIFLLGSLILTGKLWYESTIFQFWSTPWVTGTLSTLALIGAGISLLFLDDKKARDVALAAFGTIYGILSLVIYIAWGYQHIFNTLPVAEYFGFLVLFAVVSIISSIGLNVVNNKNVYLFPAWTFAFANVGVVFAVIWKYVFKVSEWYPWPLAGELLIVIIGAFLFINAYVASAKDKL